MKKDHANEMIIIPAKEKPIESNSSMYKLRVAAYCRVSTNSEDQKNSYNAQKTYYKEYIAAHSDWKLVKIYADLGLSGTQSKNRKEFMKLMRMAKLGHIDIILCKSISRFARNTVDCLDYVRMLKKYGVSVIFEKENLNTMSMTSELIMSLFAAFAQAESESISKNITWGIEKSFQKGNVRYKFNQTLGYRLSPDGKPEIIEEEAAIVCEIYELFAFGTSMGSIAKILTERQIPRRSGSTIWSRKNVEKILTNERYAGHAIL